MSENADMQPECDGKVYVKGGQYPVLSGSDETSLRAVANILLLLRSWTRKVEEPYYCNHTGNPVRLWFLMLVMARWGIISSS